MIKIFLGTILIVMCCSITGEGLQAQSRGKTMNKKVDEALKAKWIATEFLRWADLDSVLNNIESFPGAPDSLKADRLTSLFASPEQPVVFNMVSPSLELDKHLIDQAGPKTIDRVYFENNRDSYKNLFVSANEFCSTYKKDSLFSYIWGEVLDWTIDLSAKTVQLRYAFAIQSERGGVDYKVPEGVLLELHYAYNKNDQSIKINSVYPAGYDVPVGGNNMVIHGDIFGGIGQTSVDGVIGSKPLSSENTASGLYGAELNITWDHPTRKLDYGFSIGVAWQNFSQKYTVENFDMDFNVAPPSEIFQNIESYHLNIKSGSIVSESDYSYLHIPVKFTMQYKIVDKWPLYALMDFGAGISLPNSYARVKMPEESTAIYSGVFGFSVQGSKTNVVVDQYKDYYGKKSIVGNNTDLNILYTAIAELGLMYEINKTISLKAKSGFYIGLNSMFKPNTENSLINAHDHSIKDLLSFSDQSKPFSSYLTLGLSIKLKDRSLPLPQIWKFNTKQKK